MFHKYFFVWQLLHFIHNIYDAAIHAFLRKMHFFKSGMRHCVDIDDNGLTTQIQGVPVDHTKYVDCVFTRKN